MSPRTLGLSETVSQYLMQVGLRPLRPSLASRPVNIAGVRHQFRFQPSGRMSGEAVRSWAHSWPAASAQVAHHCAD